jgi:hypothetical protein
MIRDRVRYDQMSKALFRTPNLGISGGLLLPRIISWKRRDLSLNRALHNHVGSPAHAHRWRHACHWSHRCRHGSHPIPPRDRDAVLGYLCPWRCLAHSSHLLCIAESQEFTFCLACTLLPSPPPAKVASLLTLTCNSSASSKTSSGTSTSNPCPSSPPTSSSQ